MSGQTHKARIVESILSDGEKTATDMTHVSNVNQYFCELEKMGILFSFWGVKGKSRVKFRGIANRTKAEAFLKKYRENQAKTPDIL